MIDRRKFLERSVLSAGSVLFSSVLLESCTKNAMPPPGGNTPPPLPGLTIDWNDAAKMVVVAGLKMIPEAGEILGSLADILWPSTNKEDVWGEIKGQVETLVDQKIAADVYQQVTEDLEGLNNQITLYRDEIKDGTPGEKLTQWMIARSQFVNALPHFQSAGNELPLLPLLAQFTNMYLSLLRDGVVFGQSWGRTDADNQRDIQDLKTAISDITAYTAKTYTTGYALLYNRTKPNNHQCEPFRTLNQFERSMSLTVFDYTDTWPYYDATLYPAGATVILTREIYSDPYGTCDDSGKIVLPNKPTQRPTQLSVWGWDRIDAVQLTYPAGSGPAGSTQTPRMGDQSGGSNQPPHGGLLNLSPDNPIIGVKTVWGDIVNSMQFQFYDGTLTNIFGGVGSNNPGLLGYYNEALSSIHINGVSNFYGSADCVVYGFQYWQSPAATLYVIRTIYVKSPKERLAADFAKAFPKLGIPANLITDELKAARRAYWKDLHARAEALR